MKGSWSRSSLKMAAHCLVRHIQSLWSQPVLRGIRKHRSLSFCLVQNVWNHQSFPDMKLLFFFWRDANLILKAHCQPMEDSSKSVSQCPGRKGKKKKKKVQFTFLKIFIVKKVEINKISFIQINLCMIFILILIALYGLALSFFEVVDDQLVPLPEGRKFHIFTAPTVKKPFQNLWFNLFFFFKPDIMESPLIYFYNAIISPFKAPLRQS